MTSKHFRSTTIDVAAVRRRLADVRGADYWRSLEELAGTGEFREMLQREFPRMASVWSEGVSRRKFLGVMGASLALAGLSGCSIQPPSEKIVPYVQAPEELVPGLPLFYASAVVRGGFGAGVLVETHEGRPTKLEGNPNHPASLGATDVFTQASVLTMYDPDRSQNIMHEGEVATWTELVRLLRQVGDRMRKAGKGTGFRLLTETVSSPTLTRQIEALLKELPVRGGINMNLPVAVRYGKGLGWPSARLTIQFMTSKKPMSFCPWMPTFWFRSRVRCVTPGS